MKTKFFVFICFFFGIIINCVGQLYISTSHRTDAYYDESKSKYVITSEEDNSTLFKFNSKMTMFEHTTASISSTYYIKSKKVDDGNDRIEMEVVSDVGNNYLMIIDTKNENIRFISTKNGVTRAVQHKIKSSWKADE